MPGYARRSQRVEWVKYDLLHSYWNRAVGGKDAEAAYRRYVNEGLLNPEDPFKQQSREWVLGSEDFLSRIMGSGRGQRSLSPRIDDPARSRCDGHGGSRSDRTTPRG
jgi:hypothetical protein